MEDFKGCTECFPGGNLIKEIISPLGYIYYDCDGGVIHDTSDTSFPIYWIVIIVIGSCLIFGLMIFFFKKKYCKTGNNHGMSSEQKELKIV